MHSFNTISDYPFPLGEVKIVDTYPGKCILEHNLLSKQTKVGKLVGGKVKLLFMYCIVRPS